MAYSKTLLDHFNQPRNTGELDTADDAVGVGIAEDVANGRKVEFHLRIVADHVAEVRFRALGCPYTIAAASLAGERLSDQGFAAAEKFSAKELLQQLDAPPEKAPVGLVIEDAVHAALKNWRGKQK